MLKNQSINLDIERGFLSMKPKNKSFATSSKTVITTTNDHKNKPSFEDLYEYEILSHPDDVRSVSLAAAKSFVKHNAFTIAQNITVDEYYQNLLYLTENTVDQQMSIITRHKASGEIAACILTYDQSIWNLNDNGIFPVDKISSNLLAEFNLFEDLDNKTFNSDVESKHDFLIGHSDYHFVNDGHLGHGLGRKNLIMMIHLLHTRGFTGMYGIYSSPMTYKVTLDVLEVSCDIDVGFIIIFWMVLLLNEICACFLSYV
jgi:hypothetical protein